MQSDHVEVRIRREKAEPGGYECNDEKKLDDLMEDLVSDYEEP